MNLGRVRMQEKGAYEREVLWIKVFLQIRQLATIRNRH